MKILLSCDAGVSSKRKTKSNALLTETNEQAIVSKSRYFLIPTNAIRLQQEALELEDTVLNDLRYLERALVSKTLSTDHLQFVSNDAFSIFMRYGTHVNRGVLHLGGVYVQNNSYKCKSSTKDQQTENMVLWSLQKKGFMVGHQSVGILGDIKYDKEHGKLDKEYDKSQVSKIEVRVTKKGGSAVDTDINKWKNSMQSNPAIIDRGSDFERSFCGIWESIQNHSSCFKFPKGLSLFLKYTWWSFFGDVTAFNADSKEHLEEFIRMMLIDKYQSMDPYKAQVDETHSLNVLLQLCKNVIGNKQSLFSKIAADIVKDSPSIGGILDMIYRSVKLFCIHCK